MRSGVPPSEPTRHSRPADSGEPLSPMRRKPSVGQGVVNLENDAENVPEGRTVIYRPYITLRNGKKLYASAYGLKAWRLEVRSR